MDSASSKEASPATTPTPFSASSIPAMSNPRRILPDWDMEKTLELIEEYKQRPVLWDHKNHSFRSSDKKWEEWAELAAIFKMDIEEVKKKMNSLFASYRRERTKHRIARLQGTKYKSRWYGYEALAFMKYNREDNNDGNECADGIKQNDEETKRTDTIRKIRPKKKRPKPLEEVHYKNDDQLNHTDRIKSDPMEDDPLDGVNSETDLDEEVRAISKKRCKPTIEERHFWPVTTINDNVKIEADEEAFGIYVGQKMRRFDNRTKCVVQFLMSNILFQADMGIFRNEEVNCDKVVSTICNAFSNRKGDNSD